MEERAALAGELHKLASLQLQLLAKGIQNQEIRVCDPTLSPNRLTVGAETSRSALVAAMRAKAAAGFYSKVDGPRKDDMEAINHTGGTEGLEVRQGGQRAFLRYEGRLYYIITLVMKTNLKYSLVGILFVLLCFDVQNSLMGGCQLPAGPAAAW